jgi:hypothetical protein
MSDKKITHSEIKDKVCTANVNYYDSQTKECISSDQYRAIITPLGNVVRLEKTGSSK